MPEKTVSMMCGICGALFSVNLNVEPDLIEVDLQTSVQELYKGKAVAGLGLLGESSELDICDASIYGKKHSADNLVVFS